MNLRGFVESGQLSDFLFHQENVGNDDVIQVCFFVLLPP